jgi:hypothetical protein
MPFDPLRDGLPHVSRISETGAIFLVKDRIPFDTLTGV